MAQHEIWQPDISLYNSINFNDYYGSAHFIVETNGNVLWVPPAMFKVFCESNLRFWPYDTHNCFLILGSWVNNGQEIDLKPKEADTNFELFIENPEWDIVEFTVDRSVKIYECCIEFYVDVRYNITLERRSSIYRNVIVGPSFAIILFILTTFWLPTGHSGKIILNGVTALIVCIYLIYFSQKLHIMAAHTPLIGKYGFETNSEQFFKIELFFLIFFSVLFYSHTFVLVCLSTIISTITINLSHIKQPRPLPWIIKKHLDGILSDCLLLHYIVAAEVIMSIFPEEIINLQFNIFF